MNSSGSSCVSLPEIPISELLSAMPQQTSSPDDVIAASRCDLVRIASQPTDNIHLQVCPDHIPSINSNFSIYSGGYTKDRYPATSEAKDCKCIIDHSENATGGCQDIQGVNHCQRYVKILNSILL